MDPVCKYGWKRDGIVKFEEFPDQSGFVSIPNILFSSILENLEEIAILKLAFRITFLIQRQSGKVRFITTNSLLADPSLVLSIASSDVNAFEKVVRSGIQTCIELGIFLKTTVETDSRKEELLFLNNNHNKEVIHKITNGEIQVPNLPEASPVPEFAPRPNIFKIYEESIGMLTPIIAERLKELEEEFPDTWLYEAIKEASIQNHMRLSYVEGILRRWRQDGRGYRTSRGNSETVPISEIFRRRV